MGIFIIAVSCGKVPLVIGIKILGMKCCQCGCPCTNSIYPVTQFRKTVPYMSNSSIQIADVICIILHLTIQDKQILSSCIIRLNIGAIIRYMRLIVHSPTSYDSGVSVCHLSICRYIDFIGRTSICI